MSEEVTKEIAAPVQLDQCPNQDHANARVGVQMERQRERLQAKQIHTVFATTLYAFECDKHGGTASHVDLATTGLVHLNAEGLAQVIAATEALLAGLKKRVQ